MNVLLDNTFSTNHYISISEKIKKISMFFLYFNTIEHVKSLDTNYRKIVDRELTSEQQKSIKYKILHFSHECISEHINNIFQSPKFSKCLYHLFNSANILHNNQMSFTMVHFNNDDNDDNDSNSRNPVNFKLNYSTEDSGFFTSVYDCESATTTDSDKITCSTGKILDADAQTEGIFGGTFFSWLTGKPSTTTAKSTCCKSS